MCGRFVSKNDSSQIINAFSLQQSEIDFKPSFNICPSKRIPVIVQQNGLRYLELIEWGFVPFWSKVPKPLINARLESAAKKPSFSKALKNRRCIIPANGFFEWSRKGSTKQPYFICLKNTNNLAFAGIWEDWVSPEGVIRRTFAILTIPANSFMEKIHDRMPIVLTNQNYGMWINSSGTSLEKFYLVCPSDQMQAWEVSKKVNIPTFDHPDCIKKVEVN